MRTELQKGYKLKLPDRACEYEIVDLLGRGASCFAYLARYIENEITYEVILKEYNPKSLDLVRNNSGALCIPDDKRKLFKTGIDRFAQGYKTQAGMRLNSDLTNSTSNIQGIHAANQTQYIEMTYFTGGTYRIDDHPTDASLYDFLRRMKSLATVIGYYHRAGYLHLDIKPDNVFAPNTTDGKEVILFDFDSMVEKDAVACAVTSLSYTKEWAAMEQINPFKRASICEATDIFSVGEMIFYRIFGRHSDLSERRSYSNYEFDYEADIFSNVNPEVFPALNELLKKTLCNVVKSRYQSADEMIGTLDEMLRILSSTKPYLTSNLSLEIMAPIKLNHTMAKIEEHLNNSGRYFLKSTEKRNLSKYANQYALYAREHYDVIVSVDCGQGLIEMMNQIPVQNFQIKCGARSKPAFEQICDALDAIVDEKTLLIINDFHEGCLVDDYYFDIDDLRKLCLRLQFMNATVLINGSFSTERFSAEHYRYFHELLYALAEKCLDKGNIYDANRYAKKAKAVACECSVFHRDEFLFKDEKLLQDIQVATDMSAGHGFDEDELVLDEGLIPLLNCIDE